MNFKPNAWTLLFALAAGALLFNIYGNQTEETPVEEVTPLKPVELCGITNIPMNDFYMDYGRYLQYADSIQALFAKGATECPTFSNLFEKYKNLVNPNIRSFKIPKCEMREMLALNPDGEYYAYLIMKEPTVDSMVIDLAFSHKNFPGDRQLFNQSGNNDVLAAKGGADKDGVFDFTLPCPDSCDE